MLRNFLEACRPMSGYFLDHIEAMEGYVPGEQINDAGVIKLNSNENPYPPSPRVLAAVAAAADGWLRRYPEPASDTLRQAAARVYGVDIDQVIAGNGSDELLSMLMRCFVGPGRPGGVRHANLLALRHAGGHPGGHEGHRPLRRRLLDSTGTRPAARCGHVSVQPECSVRHARLASSHRAPRPQVPGILVVDEAYIDFASSVDASCIPLVRRHDNVIVLRTFSKSFSLAGLRIGLAFASKDLVAGMMKVKDSYNLNRLSAMAATAALHDLPWMRRNVRRIQRSRAPLARPSTGWDLPVYPSQTNFILARRANTDVRRIQRCSKATAHPHPSLRRPRPARLSPDLDRLANGNESGRSLR